MKVERKEQKGKFSPIVITIESEDEADLMWCKLNTTDYELCGSPMNFVILGERYFGTQELEMWLAYNKVHALLPPARS